MRRDLPVMVSGMPHSWQCEPLSISYERWGRGAQLLQVDQLGFVTFCF